MQNSQFWQGQSSFGPKNLGECELYGRQNSDHLRSFLMIYCAGCFGGA